MSSEVAMAESVGLAELGGLELGTQITTAEIMADVAAEEALTMELFEAEAAAAEAAAAEAFSNQLQIVAYQEYLIAAEETAALEAQMGAMTNTNLYYQTYAEWMAAQANEMWYFNYLWGVN